MPFEKQDRTVTLSITDVTQLQELNYSWHHQLYVCSLYLLLSFFYLALLNYKSVFVFDCRRNSHNYS